MMRLMELFLSSDSIIPLTFIRSRTKRKIPKRANFGAAAVNQPRAHISTLRQYLKRLARRQTMPGSRPCRAAVPSSDESFLRLHAAGWSIGDAAYVERGDGVRLVWLVTGTNGENRIRAEGPTRDEAWREAVGQARPWGWAWPALAVEG